MIQVGDLVRCINATGAERYMTLGGEYVVAKITKAPDGEPCLRTNAFPDIGWRVSRFVLVSPPLGKISSGQSQSTEEPDNLFIITSLPPRLLSKRIRDW